MAASDTSQGPRLPYDGLFGDSNLIRVIRQVIADPFTEYRPIDLEMLTKNRAPTVRESLGVLTSLGLLMKDESDHQHPVYRVNTESKRYLALTFLAYAVLDDRNGTDCMNDVIADYCDSEQQEKYGSYEISETYKFEQPFTGIGTASHFAFNSACQGETLSLQMPIQDQPRGGELCMAPILADNARPVLEEHSEHKIAAATA